VAAALKRRSRPLRGPWPDRTVAALGQEARCDRAGRWQVLSDWWTAISPNWATSSATATSSRPCGAPRATSTRIGPVSGRASPRSRMAGAVLARLGHIERDRCADCGLHRAHDHRQLCYIPRVRLAERGDAVHMWRHIVGALVVVALTHCSKSSGAHEDQGQPATATEHDTTTPSTLQ